MNTDEYEGHTPGPWTTMRSEAQTKWTVDMKNGLGFNGNFTIEADAKLIAAAPDLLVEVKQARKIIPQLSQLIGVEIPWKEDCPDGESYETFVADANEWNYYDSREWSLVNYLQTRWMTLETANEWLE